MGLTPLEGLIGGTRCGTIDPTAMFHHTPDAGEDAGLSGMKVTKAELLLNKQSGLKALAGTTNFATITDGMDQDDKLRRAYAIYLDRLMGYVSQYLFKLLATLPKSEIDGIVFSGGIGEKSATLQRDVLDKLAWLGFKAGSRIEPSGTVSRITNDDSAIAGWVVETDEEGWSVELAHRTLGLE
jgi:acetate kinase